MNFIPKKWIPLLTTATVFVLLFSAASWQYEGFASMYVVADLFSENAFLGITAIGMTLVILSGGIDLSVGSVIGFTSIFVATMITDRGMNPIAVWMMALLLGTSLGALMGALIQVYKLPAFLVTLGGLFFARGMAFFVKPEAVQIDHPIYDSLGDIAIPIGGGAELGVAPLIFLSVFVIVLVITHFTRFGRNLYAIGGNEESALLMGLPVARTKIFVYTANGFLSALAGITMTLYMDSGNPINATALELDAIAVVVIGGTLLTGGVGYVAGTMLGLLIYATIYQITFFASLRSSLATIAIGVLLLGFIVLQKLIHRK
ncbi:galactofuranose ABC transporter, permease protein YjfF [Aporhodopirellula aestuarii]|uniref:Sugar ABC transporter permease YjfF n=1 Tax=Aporhodopirellula aestuarii TaxID=2950107 RepID=A0ABT0TXZ1_9BACT|nr:galactofuranose ABC transporter, permease protein YjfF [Aporhodopirellula aestuarii]MCM2369128.1 sugar ABC transporter permease YjfF [Aporhodopirellula aestuarii]